MKKLLLVLLLVGCVMPRYYIDANLNSLQLDMSKQAFLANFSGSCQSSVPCATPILRAAQRGSDGSVVEVLTMQMLYRPVGTSGDVIDYWFVFKGGLLKQWGRPEDWQQVASRYEITFNPGPSVRR